MHFGRAARRLNVSQSAVSRHLRELEADLGVELLQRSSRQIYLTTAGSAVLRECREVVDAEPRIRKVVAQTVRGLRGHLRIGAVATAWSGVMPTLLSRVREQQPDIAIAISELCTSEQLSQLRAGRLDLGLVRLDWQPKDLRLKVIAREPLMIALPAGHRLAAQSEVELGALANEPFVQFPRSSAPEYFDRLNAFCLEAGFSPWISYECLGYQAQLALVASGLGVAMSTEPRTGLRPDGVVFRKLVRPEKQVCLSAVWPPHTPQGAVTAILEAFGEVPYEAPHPRHGTLSPSTSAPIIHNSQRTMHATT